MLEKSFFIANCLFNKQLKIRTIMIEFLGDFEFWSFTELAAKMNSKRGTQVSLTEIPRTGEPIIFEIKRRFVVIIALLIS